MYLILLDLVCGTFTSSGSKYWPSFFNNLKPFIIVLYSHSQYDFVQKISCFTDPIQLSFTSQNCYTLRIKTIMYFLKSTNVLIIRLIRPFRNVMNTFLHALILFIKERDNTHFIHWMQLLFVSFFFKHTRKIKIEEHSKPMPQYQRELSKFIHLTLCW